MLHWIETTHSPQFSTDLRNNIHLCLWNAQSIKGKDTLLHDYMLSSQLEVCVLTETWLKDRDDIWLQTLDLVKDGFKCCVQNREKLGGGLAIVYYDVYKVSYVDDGYQPVTFENSTWKLECGNKMIMLEVIYCPPQVIWDRVSCNSQRKLQNMLSSLL